VDDDEDEDVDEDANADMNPYYVTDHDARCRRLLHR
jgi:hypothetical protein